jgi:hypothetical protein
VLLKDYDVIRACDSRVDGIIHDGFMRKVFLHGPVPNGERFLPYEMPTLHSEPVLFVKSDYVARKIQKIIRPAVAGRNVHAVNGGASPRFRDTRNFLDEKCVLFKKRFVVIAV